MEHESLLIGIIGILIGVIGFFLSRFINRQEKKETDYAAMIYKIENSISVISINIAHMKDKVDSLESKHERLLERVELSTRENCKLVVDHTEKIKRNYEMALKLQHNIDRLKETLGVNHEKKFPIQQNYETDYFKDS